MRTFTILFILLAVASIMQCSAPSAQESTTDSKMTRKEYLAQGQKLAQQTQQVLARNLIQAIADSGTAHAVSFCSIRAVALTDSVGKSVNASIRRVTDKPRNTGNKATIEELQIIQSKKDELEETGNCSPQLVYDEKYVVGYYPIITQGLCMSCHGEKNTLDPKTLTTIDSIYPTDQATGYQTGALRGMWAVRMQK